MACVAAPIGVGEVYYCLLHSADGPRAAQVLLLEVTDAKGIVAAPSGLAVSSDTGSWLEIGLFDPAEQATTKERDGVFEIPNEPTVTFHLVQMSTWSKALPA